MIDAVARMEHARRLIDDPLLQEVLNGVEQAAIDAWASSSMGDNENREMAYHALKASRRVRDALKSVVDNGLVEAARAVRPPNAG